MAGHELEHPAIVYHVSPSTELDSSLLSSSGQGVDLELHLGRRGTDLVYHLPMLRYSPSMIRRQESPEKM